MGIATSNLESQRCNRLKVQSSNICHSFCKSMILGLYHYWYACWVVWTSLHVANHPAFASHWLLHIRSHLLRWRKACAMAGWDPIGWAPCGSPVFSGKLISLYCISLHEEYQSNKIKGPGLSMISLLVEVIYECTCVSVARVKRRSKLRRRGLVRRGVLKMRLLLQRWYSILVWGFVIESKTCIGIMWKPQ